MGLERHHQQVNVKDLRAWYKRIALLPFYIREDAWLYDSAWGWSQGS